MDPLPKILAFADQAHGSQTRKYSPERYIVHPERVMRICSRYTQDVTVLAAALLHDVLEDTPLQEGDLYAFLLPLLGREGAERAIKLVVELTDVFVHKDYPQWNRRKRKQLERARMSTISADAQTIKYADILDNGQEIVREDPSFAKVYLRECGELLKVMKDGNAELRRMTCKHLSDNLDAAFNKARNQLPAEIRIKEILMGSKNNGLRQKTDCRFLPEIWERPCTFSGHFMWHRS